MIDTDIHDFRWMLTEKLPLENIVYYFVEKQSPCSMNLELKFKTIFNCLDDE